ncbi:hypothetical protein F442_13108 [Phytophthora nicotianae P10297]|uniref:Uncharacterized protein n=1 Tax=Phytophthora nicotianae P10297 TaxID=1317064 RepID=W2YWN0_PHYNI|nr:hypothetical protein F442_13108 [Phytophthora nicotianae P10297]
MTEDKITVLSMANYFFGIKHNMKISDERVKGDAKLLQGAQYDKWFDDGVTSGNFNIHPETRYANLYDDMWWDIVIPDHARRIRVVKELGRRISSVSYPSSACIVSHLNIVRGDYDDQQQDLVSVFGLLIGIHVYQTISVTRNVSTPLQAFAEYTK